MARAPDPEFRAWIERARRVPIGEVADRRNLDLRGGRERVGPCPVCGGGKKGRASDRFSINTLKGVFRCRWCNERGGNVIALVRWLDECDFIRACETLTGEPSPRGGGSGLSPDELAKLEQDRAAKQEAERARADRVAELFREDERQRLIKLWKSAKPAEGSPVEAYLVLRRCSLPPGALLKYRPDAELYADGRQGSRVVHTGPAMLAAILGPDGKFRGLHQTWIDLSAPDGKARVPDPETGEFVPAKKVRGSATAGRIELVRWPEPRELVIGEGIETTLSVHDDLREAGRDLRGVAFWAAYSLGNIGGPAEKSVAHPTLKDRGGRPRRISGPVPAGEGIPIPESVERITYLRDGDSDPFLTEMTLQRASRRNARPGRVIVAVDAPEGMDFNDLRRSR